METPTLGKNEISLFLVEAVCSGRRFETQPLAFIRRRHQYITRTDAWYFHQCPSYPNVPMNAQTRTIGSDHVRVIQMGFQHMNGSNIILEYR